MENLKEKIKVELSGSPKPYWETKKQFLDEMSGFVYEKLNKNSNYLITDDYSSKTVKMKKAKELGVEIVSYEDVFYKKNK